MINFCIKFLICFTKPEPPPKIEPKAKKTSKLAGNKGKQPKPSVEEETKNEPEEKNENIVNCVENAREWCHIEYSLLKDVLPTVEINVVTWGEAAKVLTEEDCRSVKTALIDGLVWVYFEINHKINVFSDEDVMRFKDSKIKFTFSQDSKRMMSVVSNDWPKQFAFCNEWMSSDKECPRWFWELRQVDPPDDKYDASSHKLDTYRISRPVNKSVVTMIDVKPCEKIMESKIHNVAASLPVVEQPVEPPKKGKGKKASDAKGKTTDKGDKGEVQENSSQLLVDAGLLIAGQYNACAERTEITQTIRYAAVFVNSSKILTDEQDTTYAPLIISVQSFEALPLEYLQQLNVTKVFARYELANVLDEIETQKVSLQENIAVDETRVFFLSSPEEESSHETLMQRPSMIVLAEALLTRRLVVKVYGKTEVVEDQVVPCIFGDRPTDPFISTPDHEMFSNYKPSPSHSAEVFIGSACFNLIRLIKGYRTVEACSILTSSPLSSWDPTCDSTDIMNNFQNEEDRKSLLGRFTTPGVIPESTFIDHNTTVKLKVSTTCKLTVPEDNFLLKIDQVSHRAIVIFKDQSYNDKVIDIIDKTNRVLRENFTESVGSSAQSVQFVRNSSTSSRLSLLSTRLSDCRKLNLTLQEISRKRDIPKMITTGFFIEHEDQSILVFESMTYVIPPLITQIQSLLKSEDCARVICDSSIFFTNRLYLDFFPSSILRIKLPESLDQLLKNPLYYTKQSMLDESLQTLLLLDLLRRCRTLNSACINQLFPSCKQLVSFSKVFGIQENSDTSDFLSNASCKTRTRAESLN